MGGLVKSSYTKFSNLPYEGRRAQLTSLTLSQPSSKRPKGSHHGSQTKWLNTSRGLGGARRRLRDMGSDWEGEVITDYKIKYKNVWNLCHWPLIKYRVLRQLYFSLSSNFSGLLLSVPLNSSSAQFPRAVSIPCSQRLIPDSTPVVESILWCHSEGSLLGRCYGYSGMS